MIADVYGVRADVNERGEILLSDHNDMVKLSRNVALSHPDAPEILVLSCDVEFDRGAQFYRPGPRTGTFSISHAE